MDFKEALSVFFGLTERTRKSNMDDLTKQLKDAYARVKELQETLYTLKNSTSSDSDVNNFVTKATQVNYPFLTLDIINATPPVAMRVKVDGTSFFYSDRFSGYDEPKFVYADAPAHVYSLDVSRSGGLLRLHKEPDLSTTTYWNNYDIAHDENFSTNNRYGHPHASGSDSAISVEAVNNNLCFGENTGVPDLIRSASSIIDVGILLRKLYYWLTEIYLGSVYHQYTAAIRIASNNVFYEMEEIGEKLFADYRDLVPGIREYFKEHSDDLKYDYTNCVDEPANTMLKDLLKVFADKPRLLNRCFNNLHHFVSFKRTPEAVMCLYQFVTACVLMHTVGVHALLPAVVNAIGSDLFTLPIAWYGHDTTFINTENTQLKYKKYYLHYFDGYEYALNGGY